MVIGYYNDVVFYYSSSQSTELMNLISNIHLIMYAQYVLFEIEKEIWRKPSKLYQMKKKERCSHFYVKNAMIRMIYPPKNENILYMNENRMET